MSLKRNIAGVSALALACALSLTAISMLNKKDNVTKAASKFGDINSDGYIDAVDASIILSYYSYASTCEGTPMTLEKFIAGESDKPETTTADTSDKNVSLRTGGETFTILSWNNSEVPSLISNWMGIYEGDVIKNLNSSSGEGITAPSGAKINFVNVATGGGLASEEYDKIFNQGDDVDVYFIEPYYALKYMENDALSAPLSDIGITEKDMGEMYPYTVKLAKNSKGVYKAAPYSIAPGAFAYRSDLAEKYLGVTTPEEMQTAIGDWDKFAGSAKTIAEKTAGKVALADSVGGMWEAYSCGRFDFSTANTNLDLGSDVKSFADMAKDLWSVGGVTKNGQWTDDWTQAGQDSQCMGYFVPSWAIYNGSFFNVAAEKQTGKWGLCIGPQAYYWGGNDILVNPLTDNADDARSFVLSAAFNSDSMKKYVCMSEQENRMPNNMSVNAELAKANFYHDTPLFNILNKQNYYSVFDQSGRNVEINKYSLYDETIKTYIINEIQDSYIKDDKTWNDTMKKILDEFNVDYTDLK